MGSGLSARHLDEPVEQRRQRCGVCLGCAGCHQRYCGRVLLRAGEEWVGSPSGGEGEPCGSGCASSRALEA